MKNAKSSVYEISGARKGLTEDVAGRQRRYVISMSIRTVCFVSAVFTPSPWRWILIAGALFLPYIAVVLANAGREPTSNTPIAAQVVPPLPPKAIEPPPGAVLTSAERATVRTHAEDSWTTPSAPFGGPSPDDTSKGFREGFPKDSADGFPKDSAEGFPKDPSEGLPKDSTEDVPKGSAERCAADPDTPITRSSHTNSDTHGDSDGADRGRRGEPASTPPQPTKN
ncbi:DUF3099 domain-containing protein [Streptomyces sp. SID3343]|uniref:DUF3099 domain-containing protein n=1 Tax=Streptomyces sp. SID3343 TaxID=2690260 RepID=UPI0031F7A84C